MWELEASEEATATIHGLTYRSGPLPDVCRDWALIEEDMRAAYAKCRTEQLNTVSYWGSQGGWKHNYWST